MRRLRTLGPLALLLLAACGDDGKVGSRGAPASAPSPSAPPAAPGTTSPAATATSTARVGDWARWEVRTAGVARVTTLTWRTEAVEGDRVRIRVESTTADASGATVASTASDEWVSVPQPPPALGDAPVEVIQVGQRSL